MSNKMTVAEAMRLLKENGMTIRKVPHEREYRVNFAWGLEATACYETDLQGAVGTALAMAAHRDTHAAISRIVDFESRPDLTNWRGV
jgi:hypothetical protein